jgi:hypothetical protein
MLYELISLNIRAAAVGKTCLLLRYADGTFSSTFITTMGIDFKVNTIKLGDKIIKLQVRVCILWFLTFRSAAAAATIL